MKKTFIFALPALLILTCSITGAITNDSKKTSEKLPAVVGKPTSFTQGTIIGTISSVQSNGVVLTGLYLQFFPKRGEEYHEYRGLKFQKPDYNILLYVETNNLANGQTITGQVKYHDIYSYTGDFETVTTLMAYKAVSTMRFVDNSFPINGPLTQK